MRMMKDPDLLAFAAKSRIDISPLAGEALQKLVVDIAATPKPVIARAKAAMVATP
jgi:hypothetical protein